MVRLLPATLAALCLLAAGLATPAAARTTWLCQPGHSPNPCAGGLNATLLSPSAAKLGIEKTKVARQAPIDCFYVYPTVSDQPTPNANLTIDPQEKAIAKFQASRFSSECAVWAPMYRQLTLAGILNRSEISAEQRAIAYADVRAAWRDYLAHHNRGRGFVLIGHSQGTFVLRQLITDEIDRKPSVRRRLVSALLLGGNVTVRKGRGNGGDFRNVSACRSASQLGEAPPADAIFGRVTGADASKLEVLCTNPASLGGGSGALRTYIPTTPFPGTLGVGVAIQIGPLPAVSTPWVGLHRNYTGRCVRADGANTLRITTAPGARVLAAVPDATWGTHIADVNVALGNLTSLVHRQAAAYSRAAR
jgi:pimeloyl-ACP methyl ester carboxylesterase